MTFDGMTVRRAAYPASSSTTFHETPAHSVGTVDVVVTNPDGQSHRVVAGYTYGSPEAFDLNGAWWGYTDNGTDTGVEFEIKATGSSARLARTRSTCLSSSRKCPASKTVGSG